MAGSELFLPALFGFISGLTDERFLDYMLRHRGHLGVRRVFFSEVEKRAALPPEAVDRAAELLAAVIDGSDRVKDEALLRRLIPRTSTQMRAKVVRVVLSAGTRTMRKHVLRRVTPADAPGIEEAVLEHALMGHSEDALVGIVYRWPVELWREKGLELFEAAAAHPWLQRHIIFRTGDPDPFLRSRLITDPVTELYVRARYGRSSSDRLIADAITSVNAESEWSSGRAAVGAGRLESWPDGISRSGDTLARLGRRRDRMMILLRPHLTGDAVPVWAGHTSVVQARCDRYFIVTR